jgi:hypothetical protein
MSVKTKLDRFLENAYDYKQAIKRINRTEDEINNLRELVINEKWIPPVLTDKHVSFVKKNLRSTTII